MMRKAINVAVFIMIYFILYLYGAEKVSNEMEYELEFRKKITAPDMGIKGLKDLNTASKYDIECIKTFDKNFADLIIDYRDENGDFKGMEDLVDIQEIDEKRYKALRREFSL